MHGVDVTPAMIKVARREATAAGADNASFALGDATVLDLPDASFDGAITRFSPHHIPAPGRVLGELARVVRPGGAVVVDEALLPLELDFADWLARGSGGRDARDVIEGLLADPPAGARSFAVRERDGRRALGLRMWAGRWTR